MTDSFLERVLNKDAFLLFDGAFGTMLMQSDVPSDTPNALLNLVAPQAITNIHKQYVQAGCDVATTNTFAASKLHLKDSASVNEVFEAAIACARAANPRYVAADIGPLGEMLEPYGDLEPEEAYELFAEQAHAAEDAGANLIIIETMTSIEETVIAIRACKENSSLPVFATMTFGQSGRTFMGATPEDAATALTQAGADAIGINCSLGPNEILPLIKTMKENTDLPLIAQANAGLPQVGEDGSITYPFTSEEYAKSVVKLIEAGITIIGGCCGTDPTYITELRSHLS